MKKEIFFIKRDVTKETPTVAKGAIDYVVLECEGGSEGWVGLNIKDVYTSEEEAIRESKRLIQKALEKEGEKLEEKERELKLVGGE